MELTLSYNQRVILDIIRRRGPISRVKIGGLCNLTAGAVTRHSKELLLHGLIEVGETVTGQRGQPAQPLSIRKDGGYSVGVSFQPKRISILLVNFAGGVIKREMCEFDEGDAQQTAELIRDKVDDMTVSARIRRHRCFGLGLSVPGFASGDGGERKLVGPLAKWQGTDLEALFEDVMGCRVWVENDGAAGAFAQIYGNENQDRRNLVFIKVGYGVGCGIITNGALYTGAHGNAGEIGAFFPSDKPRPRGLDLLEDLNDAGVKIAALTDIDCTDNVTSGVVDRWLEQAAEQIQFLVNGAWFWFDPDAVILGGQLPTGIVSRLYDSVKAAVHRHHTTLPRPEIGMCKFGTDVGSLGAAFIPIHERVSPQAMMSEDSHGAIVLRHAVK